MMMPTREDMEQFRLAVAALGRIQYIARNASAVRRPDDSLLELSSEERTACEKDCQLISAALIVRYVDDDAPSLPDVDAETLARLSKLSDKVEMPPNPDDNRNP